MKVKVTELIALGRAPGICGSPPMLSRGPPLHACHYMTPPRSLATHFCFLSTLHHFSHFAFLATLDPFFSLQHAMPCHSMGVHHAARQSLRPLHAQHTTSKGACSGPVRCNSGRRLMWSTEISPVPVIPPLPSAGSALYLEANSDLMW